MFRRHSRADMAGVSLENLLASKPRFPMAARLIESWNGLTESDVIAKDTVFIILFTCVDEYFVCKDSQNHRFVIGAECPEPFAETGIDTATPVTQWSQHYQSEALRSPGATAAALKQISLPALVVLRDDPFRGRTPHLHDFILVERLMRQHVAICQTMTTAGQRRVVAVPLNSAMQFKALNLPIQSSLPWHTEAEMRAYGQVYHRLGVPVHRATQSTFEEQVCVHDRFKQTTLHNMGITSQMFGRTSNALSGKRSGAASVSPNPSFHQSAYGQ
ncbi:uncharacterized protein MONBRDRAFT_26018 [Monosiga brevicollis MX1]|uniref:Uncharacterized protein n=1 Tax=Monosiga brevicollis TaxID=81824 RepID=A9V148_MONBE|nr:uncharacterized protein MONBRDRAFT_26018 [Monosiga brevicollis MX1]EDQ88870.1 predicted protein [Monosiga brevicollis MX1]|eukprot:XP_001746483.1 hypothetical protein [Monosiga brevicollis MX1]